MTLEISIKDRNGKVLHTIHPKDDEYEVEIEFYDGDCVPVYLTKEETQELINTLQNIIDNYYL